MNETPGATVAAEVELIRVGPVRVDAEFGIVSGPGGRHRLVGDAAKVLVALARAPGRLFGADEICTIAGAAPATPAAADALARARIASCRSALRRVGAGDMLHNRHGAGYVLQVPPGGCRLSEAQDAVLVLLLASHPDRQLVQQFQLAEFLRSPEQLARERTVQAADGVRLEPAGAA